MILIFYEDPVVGSLTALECALDGFHKLSHVAEEVFGEDVFSSGRKKSKHNENVSGNNNNNNNKDFIGLHNYWKFL